MDYFSPSTVDGFNIPVIIIPGYGCRSPLIDYCRFALLSNLGDTGQFRLLARHDMISEQEEGAQRSTGRTAFIVMTFIWYHKLR